MSASLPSTLLKAIEQLLFTNEVAHSETVKTLQSAYEHLSQRYRGVKSAAGFEQTSETLAYIGARLPATYAVLKKVLSSVPRDWKPHSMLDLGAGPGTATLATGDLFPSLQTATLVESNPWIGHLAQQLLTTIQAPYNWQLLAQDLRHLNELPQADGVFLSYVLTELNPKAQLTVLQKAWDCTGQLLFIIVPGTPAGFTDLLNARQWLIDQGAVLIAPCPHNGICPLTYQEDWCHFSVRLPRTNFHKSVKSSKLAYEDEKFSYLIAAKSETGFLPSRGRIIKAPLHRTGHTRFDVCGFETIERLTLSRKDKDIYRQSQKLEWGDTWPF